MVATYVGSMGTSKRDEIGSVTIGRDAIGSVIQTGDGGSAKVEYQAVPLPAADAIQIKDELAQVAAILRGLTSDDQPKIDRALQDATEEVERESPDKREVAEPLERAIAYAKKVSTFAETLKELAPHVVRVSAWLGDAGHKLLNLIGLAPS